MAFLLFLCNSVHIQNRDLFEKIPEAGRNVETICEPFLDFIHFFSQKASQACGLSLAHGSGD